MEATSILKSIFFWSNYCRINVLLFGGGIEHQAKNDMQEIENQVALDAEKQYEIAKNGGDKVQTYVQASLVASAYLQANDEVNYNKWKAIEKQEAKNAGVPE